VELRKQIARIWRRIALPCPPSDTLWGQRWWEYEEARETIHQEDIAAMQHVIGHLQAALVEAERDRDRAKASIECLARQWPDTTGKQPVGSCDHSLIPQ